MNPELCPVYGIYQKYNFDLKGFNLSGASSSTILNKDEPEPRWLFAHARSGKMGKGRSLRVKGGEGGERGRRGRKAGKCLPSSGLSRLHPTNVSPLATPVR
ncbi:hypothetical protein V1477_011204 [Vespula maculifrons]|uniref:Uncharacterized protein n=1 Tax=Vespula maculifrons TaxID=7453 RepID=A0ABD2C452_VESMC